MGGQNLCRQPGQGHLAESVGQDKLLPGPFRLPQLPEQGGQEGLGLLPGAVLEEAAADHFQGVGDPLGVFGGHLSVGVEALEDVVLPKAHRLLQQLHHGGGHLAGGGGALFLGLDLAVGQDLAHDLPRFPAYISLRVHQKLIEQGQGLAPVGGGHVGVVLLQQVEVGADALGVLGAFGPLQQLGEGFAGRYGCHEVDGVGKG